MLSKRWETKESRRFKLNFLFSESCDLVDDARKMILEHYLVILRKEESNCKLPSLFYQAVVSNNIRLGEQSGYFNDYTQKHNYEIERMPGIAVRRELMTSFMPELIEDQGEATRYLVFNLLVVLHTSRQPWTTPSDSLETSPPLDKEESVIYDLLVDLAKRLKHGEMLWFYLYHILANHPCKMPVSFADKETLESLSLYFLTLTQSECTHRSILFMPHYSRTITLFRMLVSAYLALNDIDSCLSLIQHVETVIGVTSWDFYLKHTQTSYPEAFTRMTTNYSIYLSSSSSSTSSLNLSSL